MQPQGASTSACCGGGEGCGRALLDVLCAIIHKLDHVEILTGARQVCRSWRSAARNVPTLWRRIDMRGHADIHELYLRG